MKGTPDKGAVNTPLAFVRALSQGDLDSATACFARDGCLITPDLTAVHGRDRIRPVLAQLIAAAVQVRVDQSNSLHAGETLIARERWTIRLGGNGRRFEQTCDPTLVLRKVEGSWKLVIAAPWGWDDGRL
jgi:ketosteroid isomerase-like protein